MSRDIFPNMVCTENIPNQHQSDLMDKLRIATHPRINDQLAKRMIEEEIESRKLTGDWK